VGIGEIIESLCSVERKTSSLYMLELSSSVFKGKYLQEVTRISSCLVTCLLCWIAASDNSVICQEASNYNKIISILIPNPADAYICALLGQAPCFIIHIWALTFRLTLP
jgi:hypothetical protein